MSMIECEINGIPLEVPLGTTILDAAKQVGVKIPKQITTLFIEAHDKKHGWSSQRLKIDLSMAKNGRLTVKP